MMDFYDFKCHGTINGDCSYTVRWNADCKWELNWSDGVANEWTEEYEKLSAAMARLALLIHCAEQDWAPTFTNDQRVFAVKTAARMREDTA